MTRASAIRRGLVATAGVAVGLGMATACSGTSATAYKLPSCTQIADALPGKPALTFKGGLVDHTKTSTDSLATRLANDTYEMCNAATTQVEVYQTGSGAYDPQTWGKYSDGQTHDGSWRAQHYYQELSRGFRTAPGSGGISSFAYGSVTYSGTDCDLVAVTNNAVITVDVPNPQQPKPGLSPAALLSSCVPIGTTDLPAVLGTL
jgi:hypothetical protein